MKRSENRAESCNSDYRYIRNTQLPEIGEAGQAAISSGSVLIIGCGALGSVCGMYLAGAGVGRIGLVDFDTIDMSNLQRQLSYTESDTGKKKCLVLRDKLNAINSGIEVAAYDELLRGERAAQLFDEYDFIIEGSDNPATKYLVADTCRNLRKPYCLGGVAQFRGQVMTSLPGTAGYRDIFPEGAQDGGYLPCSIGGVFSALPGIVASIQAAEAIKYFAGCGELITDRLLLIDGLGMRFTSLKIKA